MSLVDAFQTDLAHNGDFVRTASGSLDRITGLANLKQALFHRLITVPGTLVHRPLYGVGVLNYQGNISSFVMQQKLAGLITEQFKQDVRVSKVLAIAFAVDDYFPQQTLIKVSVKTVGYSDGTEMIFTPFGGR